MKQGPTSALLPLEILRHPASQVQPPRHREHVAPVTSGFHVSLRGTFGPPSQLAIAYAAFSYMGESAVFVCIRCSTRRVACIVPYAMVRRLFRGIGLSLPQSQMHTESTELRRIRSLRRQQRRTGHLFSRYVSGHRLSSVSFIRCRIYKIIRRLGAGASRSKVAREQGKLLLSKNRSIPGLEDGHSGVCGEQPGPDRPDIGADHLAVQNGSQGQAAERAAVEAANDQRASR